MTRRRTPEGEIQHACLELLKHRGVFAWRQNNGAVRLPAGGGRMGLYRMCSINGVSDILGILPDGRFLAVECKAKGGKATEDQKAFLGLINGFGGAGWVIDDVATLNQRLTEEGV